MPRSIKLINMYVCAGAQCKNHTMSWSTLLDDVVEVILAQLSLFELARTSPTCRSFQAVYNRLMTKEQNSRCDLAADYFGRGRITCMSLLVQQLLSGEQSELGPISEVSTEYRMSADGVLSKQCPHSSDGDSLSKPRGHPLEEHGFGSRSY
jgi:hypothetical protein